MTKIEKTKQVFMGRLLKYEEELIERQQRHLEEKKVFLNKLDDLDQKYRDEIIALIGIEKCKSFLPEQMKLLSEIERPIIFDLSPEGRNKEDSHTQKIIEKRHNLYRGLGFDHHKSIEIRQKYLNEAIKAFQLYVNIGKDPEYVSLSSEQLPTNPWSYYDPPYYDEWGYSGSGKTRGTCWATHSENRWAADINCNSYAKLVGADDSDSGWSKAMSEVWVQYTMPATGLIEIYAILQDVHTNYDGCLKDESGCSDGNISQLSRSYLWTSGGFERYQVIKSISKNSDGSNICWNDHATGPGTYIYPHIFSSKTYAVGQNVIVAIGVQDDTSFWVNDMSVNPSRMTSRYFVKGIYIRSTGS